MMQQPRLTRKKKLQQKIYLDNFFTSQKECFYRDSNIFRDSRIAIVFQLQICEARGRQHAKIYSRDAGSNQNISHESNRGIDEFQGSLHFRPAPFRFYRAERAAAAKPTLLRRGDKPGRIARWDRDAED